MNVRGNQCGRRLAVDRRLIIAIAAGLAVPTSFEPLGTPSVASLTIIAMIGAILVFGWTARVQAGPGRRFVSIAAAVLVVSWLPDLFIWRPEFSQVQVPRAF